MKKLFILVLLFSVFLSVPHTHAYDYYFSRERHYYETQDDLGEDNYEYQKKLQKEVYNQYYRTPAQVREQAAKDAEFKAYLEMKRKKQQEAEYRSYIGITLVIVTFIYSQKKKYPLPKSLPKMLTALLLVSDTLLSQTSIDPILAQLLTVIVAILTAKELGWEKTYALPFYLISIIFNPIFPISLATEEWVKIIVALCFLWILKRNAALTN